MSDYFPCLEAKSLGGAFVHEFWCDCLSSRFIALCETSWTAEALCRELAAKAGPDECRVWIITDARGGQSIWNRKRVDSERERQS